MKINCLEGENFWSTPRGTWQYSCWLMAGGCRIIIYEKLEIGTQANLENWATAEKLVCWGGHVFEWLRAVEPQDSEETAAESTQGEEGGTGKEALIHSRAAGLWTNKEITESQNHRNF